MQRVWTVFKESASEWAKKWWFILSLFTVPILGLLTSSVGFTLARLENSERLRETISYMWFTNAYNGHFPYPSTTQLNLKQIALWFLQKSIALFLVFLVLYFLLGVVPTLSNPDPRHRSLLLKTGIVLFVAHILLEVVYVMIMKRFNSPTLSGNLKALELTANLLEHLFNPVSMVTFMSIGVISLLLGKGFTGKSAARVVAWGYIVSLALFVVSIPSNLVANPEFQPFTRGTLTFLAVVLASTLTMLSYYFRVPIAREDSVRKAIKEGFELMKRYPEFVWIFLAVFGASVVIGIPSVYVTYHIPAPWNQMISQTLSAVSGGFQYFAGAIMLVTTYKLIIDMDIVDDMAMHR
ncbi:MAG TPA: hypothetical protein VFB98_09510 [Candidatus Deferrimicrobium sp.]|nr:hypothetical protein [Candidatus Deferrimicrobium sp.]